MRKLIILFVFASLMQMTNAQKPELYIQTPMSRISNIRINESYNLCYIQDGDNGIVIDLKTHRPIKRFDVSYMSLPVPVGKHLIMMGYAKFKILNPITIKLEKEFGTDFYPHTTSNSFLSVVDDNSFLYATDNLNHKKNSPGIMLVDIDSEKEKLFLEIDTLMIMSLSKQTYSGKPYTINQIHLNRGNGILSIQFNNSFTLYYYYKTKTLINAIKNGKVEVKDLSSYLDQDKANHTIDTSDFDKISVKKSESLYCFKALSGFSLDDDRYGFVRHWGDFDHIIFKKFNGEITDSIAFDYPNFLYSANFTYVSKINELIYITKTHLHFLNPTTKKEVLISFKISNMDYHANNDVFLHPFLISTNEALRYTSSLKFINKIKPVLYNSFKLTDNDQTALMNNALDANQFERKLSLFNILNQFGIPEKTIIPKVFEDYYANTLDTFNVNFPVYFRNDRYNYSIFYQDTDQFLINIGNPNAQNYLIPYNPILNRFTCAVMDSIFSSMTDIYFDHSNKQNKILVQKMTFRNKEQPKLLVQIFNLSDCKLDATIEDTVHTTGSAYLSDKENEVIMSNTDSIYTFNFKLKIWNNTIYKNEDKSIKISSFIFNTSKNKLLIKFHDSDWKSSSTYIYNYPNISTKKLIHLSGGDNFEKLKFITDNIFIVAHSSYINVYNTESDSLWFSFYPLNDSDYVITTPSGLFDASPGAMKLMYYVAGMEVIELEQLKERFYEPGLLQKLLGYNKEPLRNVESFADAKLYPEINLALNEKRQEAGDSKQLRISLKNRGGGIGRTVVYINGKEISSDVRGVTVNPNADSATVSIDISNHPYLKVGDNTIEVKAYNTEGYLVSRGAIINYTSTATSQKNNPSLYTICIGTSDYTGTQIDLKYAAKDANDISKALSIGAKNLFGTDKVYSYLVNTDYNNLLQPTKAGIKKVFEEISKKAKSEDVIVVYLSGHGINWGGQDGDFFYLTKDAYTANIEAYNDPAIRASTTLSSAELTELIKSVPALKQVLILDACASGRAVENLIAKRDISSSTLRALDRMKDRTGMHIITGCAADAVSYEASRYGQGVLTYSLLEGIKGAALREGKFADVNLIFQHARERVPQLASGIGGIQEPKIFSPYGGQSFDIGELNDEDKKLIPLSKAKSMFIMSNFIDLDQSEDVLNLSGMIDNSLIESSSRGSNSDLIFVNVKDFPDAYKLSGIYQQKGKEISLKLKIKSQSTERKIDLKAKSVDELRSMIAIEIDKTIKK